MGAKDEIGQVKRVKCTYKHCQMRFDTEKEMKHHKRDDPDHFYCKKCNVDCEDWNELKAHKVDAMAPWIDGRMKGNKDESPMHIVCEFCGMDFKSFGGRKIHREQTHPADQKIVCTQCHTIFTRAGNYIKHFQENQCSGMSRLQFLDLVQEKHVQAQIMDIQENLESNKESYQLNEGGNEDIEEGGINLIDEDDANQSAGIPPLQVEAPLLGMNHPSGQRYKSIEAFPYLPNDSLNQVTESTRKLSIASTGAESANESLLSASEFASQITSRRGGIKVYTESWPSLKSPGHTAPMSIDDDTASVASTAIATSSVVSGTWTGNASQALFKDAKPTPRTIDYDALLRRREEEVEAHPQSDLMRARFWDPNWEHFNIDIFKKWDTEKGKELLQCPFPGCEQFDYETGIDLTDHLRQWHVKKNFRCPACLKIYKSPAALISHSESTGKCKIQKGEHYGKLLNELSGGLLSMEHPSKPKIAKVTEGEEAGIMTTKFTAQPPKKDPRW